ncbi:MAG: hypothetical protein LQ344_004003 [Seirophora lacunosa]|nr:MAG: hypothetical protein LQ344_004003 [Seirophora lacunosa]
MSLGPSLSRDPTLPHNVHHRASGTYGAADALPPDALPPLHCDDMGVRGPNLLFPQDQLPSMRDVEYGTYLGLPQMSHLVRLPKIEARTRFIQVRAAALPRETEAEHDRVFQLQWDEELRRNKAASDAFAQRIWAGTVDGVPPMHRLVGMGWDGARRVYMRARQVALPQATDFEHENAFREQWTEQMRQGEEADPAARAAEATAQAARAAHAAGHGRGSFLARPCVDPAVAARGLGSFFVAPRAAEATARDAQAAQAAGGGQGSFLARPRAEPDVAARAAEASARDAQAAHAAARGRGSFFAPPPRVGPDVAARAAEATARDVQAAHAAGHGRGIFLARPRVEPDVAARAAHAAREAEAEAASEAAQAAHAAGHGQGSFFTGPPRVEPDVAARGQGNFRALPFRGQRRRASRR